MPSHRVTLSTLVDLAEQLDPSYGILQSAPQSNGTRRYALIAFGEQYSQRYIPLADRRYKKAKELEALLRDRLTERQHSV